MAQWAHEEGCHSVEELLEVSFGTIPLEEMFAKMQAQQRVETSFDVLGFLFSHIGGGGSVGGLQAREGAQDPLAVNLEGQPQNRSHWGFAPTSRIQLPKNLAPSRRNGALALISVMAADGQVRPRERAYLEAFLLHEELAPLQEAEIKLRRPHEIGPVGGLPQREALIERMLELAHIDEEADESEVRLIREYARHWGVDPARIDAWIQSHEAHTVSGLSRMVSKIKDLLLA